MPPINSVPGAGLPPAVVVGMCAHGLAIARALARQGVETHVLETNDALPGVRTRHATVHFVGDINGPGLIEALRELRARLWPDTNPVLFLTNDNMIRQVAQDWPRLEGQYRLSWSACREAIARLVMKSALEERCRQVGSLYPRTWLLEERAALAQLMRELEFPVIAKPVKPLSAFKARVLETPDALARLVAEFAGDLPFLIQDWIPGDDTRISFCALYLDRGKVLSRFDGRKLRSRPMGHTSIAEPVTDEAVYREALRFFDGLELSGPVSLELKRDDLGRLWVIEPTVGRTDFWLGCCIANGVNLPYVQYRHQAGLHVQPVRQQRRSVWFNLDRDPLSLFWYYGQVIQRGVHRRSVDLLYLASDDLRPFFSSLAYRVREFARRLTRKAATALRS